MEKYGLGWRDLRKQSQLNQLKSIWSDFTDFILFSIVIYIIISGFSLIAVAMGEDVPYISFWHAPWRFLFQLLGLV